MQDASFLFDRRLLNPAVRVPGLSGFLRVRNGADFLAASVESHLPFFDEIVIVYNQCTDRTPEIAETLASRHPAKIRAIHYQPRVHPPGTDEHRREPWDSPRSYVNYNNFALAATTRHVVSKLDDDHLALPRMFRVFADDLRRWPYPDDAMVCFSGLNLGRSATGEVGILRQEPFSGNGDIGFWRVSEATHFIADPRFARFDHRTLRRRYHSLVYWHVKHLKTGGGFANYELDRHPESRYHRRYARFLADRQVVGIRRFTARRGWMQSFVRRLLPVIPVPGGGKWRIRWERFSRLHASVSMDDIEELRRCLPGLKVIA